MDDDSMVTTTLRLYVMGNGAAIFNVVDALRLEVIVSRR